MRCLRTRYLRDDGNVVALYCQGMWLRVFCLACLPLALCLATPGQEPQRAAYEIVSVRHSAPDASDGSVTPFPKGIGYQADHVTLREMLAVMYRVPTRQVVGGPEWAKTERFDVVTKADRTYSIDELHAMFVDMLRDRFHMSVRLVAEPGPAYLLTVAPAGLKMQPVDAGTDRHYPIVSTNENRYIGDRVPLNYLCFWLGQNLQEDQREVVDHTGLTGTYSFTLAFRPQLTPSAVEEEPQDEDLPSIFNAVKEQLGLVLTPGKAPVQKVVIERAEQPSAN